MRRVFLYGMLAGAVLVFGAFAVRDAADDYARLKNRVAYMEGYLRTLDSFLREAR